MVVSATEAMATSKAGCSHQPITLAKKLEIIKTVESGRNRKLAIPEEFCVAKSTVSSIVKRLSTHLIHLASHPSKRD